MNDVKKLLRAIAKDPKAKELLKGVKDPETVDEAVELYAGIADKLGFAVSKENLKEFLTAKEEAQQALTAKVEGDVKVALKDEVLESVAGGAVTKCADTFAPGEWCWVTDSCAVVINYYDDPAIAPDNTYTCPSSALSIDTKDVIGGESGAWEDWNEVCLGGWFYDCQQKSVAFKKGAL